MPTVTMVGGEIVSDARHGLSSSVLEPAGATWHQRAPSLKADPRGSRGRPIELPATLARSLARMPLGAPLRLLTLLPGMRRRVLLSKRLSRRPLAARTLLWSHLLSRGIRLRLDPLRFGSPSTLLMSTLDGWPFLPGRRRSLHGLPRPLFAGSWLRSRLLSRSAD